MRTRRTRTFPITVTQLPVVRCAICHREIAHRPGQASAVLTAHYAQEHADVVGRREERPAD
jgi:hypothetical protein